MNLALSKEKRRKWPAIFDEAPSSVAVDVSKVTCSNEGALWWFYKARNGGKMGCFWRTVVGEHFSAKGSWRSFFWSKNDSYQKLRTMRARKCLEDSEIKKMSLHVEKDSRKWVALWRKTLGW